MYRPLTLRARKISAEAGSLSSSAQLITSANPALTITVQNDPARSLLGSLASNSLAVVDGERESLLHEASRWLPFARYIPRGLQRESFLKLQSSVDHTDMNLFIQAFPFREGVGEGAPDKLFWLLDRCRSVDDDNLVLYLIHDYLVRIVEACEGDGLQMLYRDFLQNRMENLSEDEDSFDEADDVVEKGLESTTVVRGLLTTAQGILGSITTLLDPLELPASDPMEHFRSNCFIILGKFLAWTSKLDALTGAEDTFDGGFSLPEEKPTSHLHLLLEEPSLFEKKLGASFAQELQLFFVQVRESSVISRLLLLLRRAKVRMIIIDHDGYESCTYDE